uniref:Vacuolar protein sorting-associated protein 52 homolog n=1 Tax=Astyanax mexicanus TaxID=7994 RepID=A0A3B1IKR6_ASTMX
ITTDEFILDEWTVIHIQANLEDELVQEALKTGVDLRQYSKQVEAELQRIEQASIKDYIKESQNIASLHNQITACDSILEVSSDQSHADLSCLSVSLSIYLSIPLSMCLSGDSGRPVTSRSFSWSSFMNSTNKINFAKELSFRRRSALYFNLLLIYVFDLQAVSKIREFILQKIYSFRKPMTNYQIPQNTLLKYRFFYQFLLANERTVAKEIRDEYVDTMSKIYFCYFKSYSSRLLKVQVRNVLAGFFSKPSLKSRNTIFTLGQRGAVLSPAELEGPILSSHTPPAVGQHSLLLDNGCREFLFLSDFFHVAGNSAPGSVQQCDGEDPQMFLKNMSAYVSDCYDSILCSSDIHIILRFKAITARGTFPRPYWEWCFEMLWPTSETPTLRKLGVLDTRTSLLYKPDLPNERTNALLGQLQIEVENFVLKMAAEFPSRKDQLIFLINNYDMMLGVLMERAADDSKEVEGFQQLLLARTQEFIEEILAPPFGGMITFVKESEALMEKGQLDKLKNDEVRITQLVRGFSSSWKQSVEALSQDVMRSFTNFKNGTSIIQGALTQLIQYYHGFHKILSQPTFRSLAVRSELINLHHLMVEVKKHKPNF